MPRERQKPRTFVKTFMPRFAEKIRDGSKLNTIRPWPKRQCDIPRVAMRDRISCREWTGKPYASKQGVLREAPIVEVLYVEIRKGSVDFPGVRRVRQMSELTAFARADGFKNLQEFWDWFLRGGKRTMFQGIYIRWALE